MTGRPQLGPMDPTEKQLEVLERLGLGQDMPEIARDMQISVHTARGHLKTAMERLDAKNGTHAFALAVRRGFLTLTPLGGPDAR